MFDKMMLHFSQLLLFLVKYWALFFLGGHFMPLYDSNSSKMTGNGGEVGITCNKRSLAGCEQGTLQFRVSAVTPRPPELPRYYIFLCLRATKPHFKSNNPQLTSRHYFTLNAHKTSLSISAISLSLRGVGWTFIYSNGYKQMPHWLSSTKHLLLNGIFRRTTVIL